jgi:hypothetical protein
MPQGGEIDALTRHQIDPAEQLSDLIVTGGPGRLDRLSFGHPGGEILSDRSGEDDVGRPPENPGPGNGQGHAGDRGDDDRTDLGALGSESSRQPARRRLEVGRLLADHPTAVRAATGDHVAGDPLGLLHLPGPAAHDASALSWDSTISR